MAETKARSNAVAKAAKGDLTVGSGTNTSAVLAVGSNTQILVADSTASTGLKWATAAMTLIQRSSFSSVANTGTTFDGVFSSTYKSYQIVIETLQSGNAGDDAQLQYRYAGPTTEVSNYYGNTISNVSSSSTTTNTSGAAVAQITLSLNIGNQNPGGGTYFVELIAGATPYAILMGSYFECNGGNSASAYFQTANNVTRTGFLLKSSSSNITGTVAVYGLV